MNKHDRDNLDYILSLDAEAFDAWMTALSEDDVQYAIELIQAKRLELVQQEMDIMDDVTDVSDAAKVLAAIMAK